MDPLSLTASIITVLELTATLTSYISHIRKATQEQAQVAVEASNLYSLLTSLRFRVEAARSSDPWFNQVKLLGIENGPLDQFKDILKKMVEQISGWQKRDHVKSALLWGFTKSQIDDVLKRTERLKSLLLCALTQDLSTLTQAIHRDIESLGNRMTRLDTRASRLQSHANQELQHRLSQWLGIPDPSTNHHAALRRRHPDTGMWLVNGPQFREWKSSKSSRMWLHGSAGCGKTVLCATALQELFQLQDSQPNTVVGYFYFDFNDIDKQTSRKAIRSLLHQFAQHKSIGVQAVERLYQRCGSGQQQPSETAIRLLLQDVLNSTASGYIVLDALDECTDREELLGFLISLLDLKRTGVRFLATSRRERDIEEQLAPITTSNINIQSALVDEDIRVYVQSRLRADPKLMKWPDNVRNEILNVIMEKANGMHCVKLRSLRHALTGLPNTLDETYDRILRDLESRGQLQDAIMVLRWLCYSKRPLRVSEVVEILAIECDDDAGFRPEERLPDPGDVMVICSGLIQSSPVNPSDYDEDDEYEYVIRDGKHRQDECDIQLQLAHFSVKEYLLSPRCRIHSDFQNSTSHRKIAEGCLHYFLHLVNKLPLTKKIFDDYPLARYAAKNCWWHAQKIPDADRGTISFLASELLTLDSATLLAWVQVFDVDASWRGLDLSITSEDIAPPLYYVAAVGMKDLVHQMIEEGVDVNIEGGKFGNPLQVAVERGHEAIAHLLINEGAEVNASGGFYGNSLQAASACGHKTIVQRLLDAGADVNAQNGVFGNALIAASEDGHEEIVRLLLDGGASVNAEGAYHGIMWRLGPQGQRLMVEKIMLDDADSYEFEKYRGDALQSAASNGHANVVRLLLSKGANVNTRNGVYGAALQAASERGHLEIVQMLIEHGADVSAQGGYYGNALQAASISGSVKVVRSLLSQDADVNAHSGFYGNALQAASYCGHEEAAQILLACGADVNAQGGYFGQALQAASEGGHARMIEILLKAGAKVYAQGGAYGNALQAASYNGSEDVVRMLLEEGAPVNIIGGWLGTALQAASHRGHEKVVQMLLDAGANVNVQGGNYGNALQAAWYEGHERVIRILLDNGASKL